MLAIVIPYYKITFFEATLQSLAYQTDKRFKVYIGDDGSLENPKELLGKFQRRFDFVYHRFETNLGRTSLTQQWDRCIALSGNEEWIMILGDDDVLGENVVKEFYKQHCIFYRKSNIIRYASVILNEQGKSKSDVFTNPIWESATDSFYRKIEGFTRSTLSEYIFLKSSYSKYGFSNYPLAWFSDDNAWLDFSEGKLIYSINNEVIYVRLSNMNISGRVDNLKEKNQAAIFFYKNIFHNRLQLFAKKKRIRLIFKYESALRIENKLTKKEWLLLLFRYIDNYEYYPFKKFIKRSLGL